MNERNIGSTLRSKRVEEAIAAPGVGYQIDDPCNRDKRARSLNESFIPRRVSVGSFGLQVVFLQRNLVAERAGKDTKKRRDSTGGDENNGLD